MCRSLVNTSGSSSATRTVRVFPMGIRFIRGSRLGTRVRSQRQLRIQYRVPIAVRRTAGIVIPRLHGRFPKSSSQQTRRWRAADSNPLGPPYGDGCRAPGPTASRQERRMLEHAGGTAGPRDRAVDGGLRNEQGPSSDIMLADQRQDPSSNARAASVSSEAVPADLLTIRAPAPDWFRWAISHPGQSQFVMVAGAGSTTCIGHASRRDRASVAFFSFTAAVRIATGGATLRRTSPAIFASRRLICPAWATAPGERTTTRSFAPRKSAP
jgi:hypothetical protein